MIKFIILFISFLFILSCQEGNIEKADPSKKDSLLIEKIGNSEDTTSAKEEKAYQQDAIQIGNNQKISLDIHNKIIDVFKIGDRIQMHDGYVISKEMEEKIAEDGAEIVPVYKVKKGKEIMLKIYPEYDSSLNGYSDKIGEMMVLASSIQTNKNIGIGSTLKEFVEKYPEYDLWYTYISDIYVIQPNNIEVQFLLNENDYVKNPEIQSDRTPLNIKDFKPNAKIQSIRIF